MVKYLQFKKYVDCQVAEETAHLAPHGVPSNPIPRALSSTRLHELANQDAGYGATYQTGADGSLNIPGAAPTNPFVQNGSQGGGGYRSGFQVRFAGRFILSDD